jgi:hypothetical protein
VARHSLTNDDLQGEINHDRSLMLANASFPMTRVDRTKVMPRFNGITAPRRFSAQTHDFERLAERLRVAYSEDDNDASFASC